MTKFTAVTAAVVWGAACLSGGAADAPLVEPAAPFVGRVEDSLASVTEERKALLKGVSDYVVERAERGEPVRLVFICTHNSRRSQLAQVWCQTAAAVHGVPGVEAYSGGTEATACNVRTVRALRRAGLSAVAASAGVNPVYLVQFSEARPPLRLFSKVYSEQGNPTAGFAALMCCSDADAGCPLVAGSDARFALHYEDPKAADNGPAESQRYDERSFQIAQEMFYVMSDAAGRLGRTKAAGK